MKVNSHPLKEGINDIVVYTFKMEVYTTLSDMNKLGEIPKLIW